MYTNWTFNFVIAASSNLPHDSDILIMVAKSAIVITVADDFFYMEASPSKLKCLTNAIQRYTLDEEKKKKKRRYSKIVNSSYIYIFYWLIDGMLRVWATIVRLSLMP